MGKEIPGKNMLPKVSIIILNYKGFGDTIECLKSLREITYPIFNVLVVDNASPNESVKKIEEFISEQENEKLEIEFIKAEKNNGFAAGCNIGLKKVFEKGADYALLLNPDTFVEKDFLDKLIEIAEKPLKDKKIGFLAPRIFYADKKTIYFNGGKINWSFIRAFPRDHGKSVDQVKPEKEPFVSDYISGTCLLISKSAYEEVGPMDEDYFMYCEDADWAIQAKKKRFSHFVVPDSVIYHKGYHSTGYLSYFYIYYLVRNGYFLAKNRGAWWQKIFVYIYSFLKFLKQFPKLPFVSKRKWASPIMKATIDFWRGRDRKRVLPR